MFGVLPGMWYTLRAEHLSYYSKKFGEVKALLKNTGFHALIYVT